MPTRPYPSARITAWDLIGLIICTAIGYTVDRISERRLPLGGK